jgi:cytochrome c-type biogenesis protein CcsB
VNLSALSDELLNVAILTYVIALMLHAAEFSLSNRRQAAALVDEKVLVGAGGPPVVVEPATPEKVRTDWGKLTGNWALWLTGAAALAHFGAVACRGLAAHRMPWGNMYEFVISATFVGAVAWMVMAIAMPQVRRLGLLLTLVQVLLLGFAGMILYTQISPLVPALQSYWYVIHVTSIVLSSGLFLVGFLPAAMFLIRDGHDKGRTRFPYSLGGKLPAAEALERLTFRMHAFAFPIWTFAVSAGAIWAEAAWGRYWGWDPKETWAFISWVVYAGYLHARSTPSVNRRVVAWIAIIGWLTVMMNLIGVNFFFTGLHSYAGVS